MKRFLVFSFATLLLFSCKKEDDTPLGHCFPCDLNSWTMGSQDSSMLFKPGSYWVYQHDADFDTLRILKQDTLKKCISCTGILSTMVVQSVQGNMSGNLYWLYSGNAIYVATEFPKDALTFKIAGFLFHTIQTDSQSLSHDDSTTIDQISWEYNPTILGETYPLGGEMIVASGLHGPYNALSKIFWVLGLGISKYTFEDDLGNTEEWNLVEHHLIR